MKRLPATERSRAAMLVVAACLVAGTGCITMSVMSDISQKRQQQVARARAERRTAEMRVAAAGGDQHAMTQLGWEEVADRLRQRVRDSERQYPAPPTATRPAP